jgi:tyrosyl-tRNA synthetase
MTTSFLADAKARGFFNACTDEQGLDAKMAAGPIAAYAGFDLTADSLHVGHLLSIMTLRLLQRHGHKPIVLLGGGTSQVGDPSGKDDSRRLMDDAEIAGNKAGIQKTFARFLRFGDGPTDAVMLDNADWLSGLSYIPFLRDVGSHFSIARMLRMDSVRQRLDREQNLSLLEFGYMVLQAYDFVEINRRTGCLLQLGGSDQWGNIVSGIDLARRMDGTHLLGMTTPLITDASGNKIGKTTGQAVWLNPDRLSAFDF